MELDESNGAGETVTHNISNINFGTYDEPNTTPASYPIPAGENSMEKYIRYHVTDLGGSNKVKNLQVYKYSGAYVTGEGIQTNLKTSAYSALTYAAPSRTTFTDQAMPTADPAAANLGIGGSLTGGLTAAGYSDYCKMQLQTTASTPAGSGNQKVKYFQYDEE